jgi:hypothetical protein
MVRVFRQKFALEDAIGSHACSLEVNMRVTNGIPLGCSFLLPVDPVNSVQTLKALPCSDDWSAPRCRLSRAPSRRDQLLVSVGVRFQHKYLVGGK